MKPLLRPGERHQSGQLLVTARTWGSHLQDTKHADSPSFTSNAMPCHLTGFQQRNSVVKVIVKHGFFW